RPLGEAGSLIGAPFEVLDRHVQAPDVLGLPGRQQRLQRDVGGGQDDAAVPAAGAGGLGGGAVLLGQVAQQAQLVGLDADPAGLAEALEQAPGPTDDLQGAGAVIGPQAGDQGVDAVAALVHEALVGAGGASA